MLSLEADFGIKAGSVILAGVPADALERYGAEEGDEVLVMGSSGRSLSKLMLGSCASRLAGKAKGASDDHPGRTHLTVVESSDALEEVGHQVAR